MFVIRQQRLNLPANIPLNFVAVRKMTIEGQSDKMASDMEVRMKQRCVIEFLHVEKIASNDIHRRLLKVYGDQTVDLSTVRQWVAQFSRATATWKTSHVLNSHTQLSHHEMKSISITISARISGLWLGKCVWNWILTSTHWKQWWQRWNIA